MKELPQKFNDFVAQFTALVDNAGGNEATILERGRTMLAGLVSQDNWLPENQLNCRTFWCERRDCGWIPV